MNKIEYIQTDERDLDMLSDLWGKMKDFTIALSPIFAFRYVDKTFEWRKTSVMEHAAEDGVHIELAKDRETGEIVGYCLSIVSKEKQGEIVSIYIEPEYRDNGIGVELMTRSLAWMESHSVFEKTLEVATGNEKVFAFYSKFGFFPRTTILEQVKK